MRATNHIYAFHMSVLVFVTLCFTEPVHARTVYAIAKHYGCTEIPLLVDPKDCLLPTLDSTRLLARAALRKALAGGE